MSGGSRVKKQHYVQQSYLQEFATSGRLHVFDKSLRSQFPANVRDICSERSFYEFEGLKELTGSDQRLEHFFHSFEDMGIAVIRETVDAIRSGTFAGLRKPSRIDLALFLAAQHLRTKRTRELLGGLMESVSKEAFLAHMRETQPDFPLEEALFSVDADECARFAAHFYLVTNEDVRLTVSRMLSNRIWILLHNDSGGSFYTSDHPIVEGGDCSPVVLSTAALLAKDVAAKLDGTGIFNKILPSLLLRIFAMGVRVAFPLAPDIILLLLDRWHYANGASLDGHVQRMGDVRDLDYYNGLQVLQSYRQVYSKDSDFTVALRHVQ
jgi:hypothetical protein